jgi:hypothetical protein
MSRRQLRTGTTAGMAEPRVRHDPYPGHLEREPSCRCDIRLRSARLPEPGGGYTCHVPVLPGAIGWIVGAESPPGHPAGYGEDGGRCNRSYHPVRGQARSCPWRA